MANNQNKEGSSRSQGGGRGFASMDQERQREIASMGGRAAHERGTAHEFTSEEAREAGRKGGEAVSQDRRHMAMIGSKGGQSRGSRARRNQGDATTGAAQPARGDDRATPVNPLPAGPRGGFGGNQGGFGNN